MHDNSGGQMTTRDKRKALEKFCNSLFATKNLIGTDIEVSAARVDRDFEQDSAGVRIQLTVSNHIIGKMDIKAHEALAELLDEDE